MCCCGEPVHAQDGDERVLLQLTHHRSPTSSSWHVAYSDSPVAVANWESG
ncbi:MAG: hypothetical protein A07HR60_00249 [uncultured archaeon A07HR60]|nr:MAG: hypothetical protein A07HR60_00249 [uncultured archaeon A07HR60]